MIKTPIVLLIAKNIESLKTSNHLGYFYVNNCQPGDYIIHEMYTIFDLTSSPTGFGHIHSASKVNAMKTNFAVKLGFISKLTNVCIQKINSSSLETYSKMTVGFLLHELKISPILQADFLLIDSSMNWS